jgi:DNA replication protein DnaC
MESTLKEQLQKMEFVPPQGLSRQSIQDSYKEVELTEEEREYALYICRMKKSARIKLKEHADRIRKPRVYPKHTAEDLEFIAKKRFTEMMSGEFYLTDDQMRCIKALSYYFTNDKRLSELEPQWSHDKGIILWGGIGVGKTTIMKSFAINPKMCYDIISSRQVASEFRNAGGTEIEKYFELQKDRFGDLYYGHEFRGVCFDDLGTEEMAKNYGNSSETMADVILNRYDFIEQKNATHLTMNIGFEDVQKVYGERVRSRMKEMFNVYVFPSTAKDMRK